MNNGIQGAPAKSITPFHVGILVADLEGAIKRFSDVFGIKFGPVQEMIVNAHGGVEGKVKMKVAYSTQGPFYIELIEGSYGDSLFSLKNGEGVHHLGVWSEDFPSYQERETGNKLPAATKLNYMPGDPQHWFSNPADLCGTRIEFIGNKMRRGIEAWIQGEDLL